ncbi:MAG: hypothetical protein J6Q82_06560 [Clostridia bacterium]|nr:hypothetical protein [Clostridia bacterium]
MRTNWLKRAICFLLVALMLGTSLILTGCFSEDTAPNDTEETTLLEDEKDSGGKKPNNKENNGENNEENNEDDNTIPAPVDDGVGTQDFGGREIRFLGWTAASANEFEVDEGDTGTLLKSAVYARNKAVKERLNVNLKWQYIEGHAGFEFTYAATAGNMASVGNVDIFTPYSRVGAVLMINGITRDMKNIAYLDLEDPWWNPSIVNDCAVNGKVYFAGGDTSWTLAGNAIAFFYNKDILSQYSSSLAALGATSMYDLVQQKKWTIDNMLTLSKAVKDTSYGLAVYLVSMDAFYKASDLKWMEVNDQGQQKISDDVHSGKMDSLLSKFLAYENDPSSAMRLYYSINLEYASNNGNRSNPIMPEWKKGQALFTVQPLLSVNDFKFHELGFDFGVLPMPLYDSDQTAYKTTPDFEYSVVAIPRNATGIDELGAVLQVMASEGQSRILPAYYEATMKMKPSDDAKEYEMWKTVLNSVELDPGRMFDYVAGAAQSGFSFAGFRVCLQLQKTTTEEYWLTNGQNMQNYVNDMNVTMAQLEAKYNS